MFLLRFLLLIISAPLFAYNTLGLPPLDIPLDNPQSPEKIALGREFFNDPQFSQNASISCSSCHLQELAFSDGKSKAVGIKGYTGTRNAPTVANAAFFQTLFIDGRSSSLEDQALQPMLNPIEHGLKDSQEILAVALKNPHYTEQLQQIFQISKQEISVEHIAKAIASFERSLVFGNSRFDQYFFKQDRTQLSESAARGLRVFKRKGNCANCHEISWNNALFTDNRFYNIGVGFKLLDTVQEGLIESLKKGNNFPLSSAQQSELGQFNTTLRLSDIGKFKTPTLRNITLTAPYMHDGSLKSLEEVVEYYDKGGDKNPYIDSAIYPLHLSDQEKEDLVNFMQALTSEQFIK